MDNLLYIPISKVDDEQRMVYGYATTESVDSQDEIVKLDAVKEALPDYLKYANIREMHQPSAVGKAVDVSFDEKGMYLGAKVVDDNAWKKVKEGVYNGYSIGGAVLNKVNGLVNKIKLTEISLVDRPSNPDTTFTMWKMDTEAETMNDLKKQDEVTTPTDAVVSEEVAVEGEKVTPEASEQENSTVGETPSHLETENEAQEAETSENDEIIPDNTEVEKNEETVGETPEEAGETPQNTESEEKTASEDSSTLQKVATMLEKGDMPSDEDITALLKAQNIEPTEMVIANAKWDFASQILDGVAKRVNTQHDIDAQIDSLQKAVENQPKGTPSEYINLLKNLQIQLTTLKKDYYGEDEPYVPYNQNPQDFATNTAVVEAMEDLPDLLSIYYQTICSVVYSDADKATKATLLRNSADQFVAAMTDETAMYLSENATSLQKAGKVISAANQKELDNALANLQAAIAVLARFSGLGGALTPSEVDKLKNGVQAGSERTSQIVQGANAIEAIKTPQLALMEQGSDLAKMEATIANLEQRLAKFENMPAPMKARTFAIEKFETAATKNDLDESLTKADQLHDMLMKNPTDPTLQKQAHELAAKIQKLQRESVSASH